MKKFETKLANLKVPIIKDDPLENDLRRDLANHFFSRDKIYKKRFRVSMTFAAILLLFGCATVLNPRIALRLNNLAFKNAEPEFPEFMARDDVPEQTLVDYSSINNPKLEGKLDPAKYREDKAYIVRRYISADDGSVMIVSEYDKEMEEKQITVGSK